MPAIPQLARLTRVDMGDLHRVCGQLDAAAAVLVQSSWNGKFPVLTMLDQAKQTIAALYNRSEAAYLEQLRRKSTRTLQQALAEEVAKDQSPSAPCARPGSSEA